VGCYKRGRKLCPGGVAAWEQTGCAKIAVKCPSEEEMRIIYDKALKKGLPMYLVEDAGRTQIAAGSRTVLGIGPCPTKNFDDITSNFKTTICRSSILSLHGSICWFLKDISIFPP